MTLPSGRKITIEARVDPRCLATCASAFAKNNIPITSRSQLISLIAEIFCDSLVNDKVVPWVETTPEALQILNSVGIKFTELSKRNIRSIALQIHAERSIAGLGTVQVGVPELTPELIDEALRKHAEQED